MTTRRANQDPERLWRRVLKHPGGCWEWTGAKNSAGYGHLYWGGRLVYAHRLAWEMEHGPITDGLCALHACDNPACVNPAHLFLGTKRDNRFDCLAKGRAKKKLNPALVQRVRAMLPSSTLDEIALEVGVSAQTIRKVRDGKVWGWVA